MLIRIMLIADGVVLIGAGLGLALFFYTRTGMIGPAFWGMIPVIIGGILISVSYKLKDSGSFGDFGFFGKGPVLSPDAQLAVGTVQSIDRTHLTVNDIPQYRITLRVRDADLREFTGELKVLVSPHEMSGFRPGTIMPVTYEPGNPSELFTVPADHMEKAQRIFNRQQVQLGLVDPLAEEICGRGVPATGVIMSMNPTGEIRHGYTGLDITVRFADDEGNLLERSKRMFLPGTTVSQLSPGSQVKMRMLPEDDTRFVLEFNPSSDTHI